MLGGRRCRDRLGKPGRDRLVAAQHVIGVDPERPLGDLGRHGRIAVSVAADPRLPGQERRDPRRARAGPSRVDGLGRLAASRPPTRPAIEGRVGRAIDPRHDAEQRLVEEGEGRPDLVQRGHGARPEVGGPPEQRDLLAEPAPHVAILVGRRCRDRPAGGGGDRFGAGRSGRVRRRASVGWAVRTGLIRRRPSAASMPASSLARSAEPVDRGRERVVRRMATIGHRRPAAGRALGGPLRPTGLAHELALLGEVDEPEVEAERPDDDLGPVGIERGELLDESGPKRRIVPAPEPDGRSPDALDEIEQRPPGLLGDHLAEERAEEPDLERERIAGAAGADGRGARRGRPRSGRGRLGRSGRDGSGGRRGRHWAIGPRTATSWRTRPGRRLRRDRSAARPARGRNLRRLAVARRLVS